MNDNMRRFVKGLLSGLVGQPVGVPEKEPVAYLYNGVRLPKQPEWDKTAYQYAAVVLWTKDDKYPFYCFCVSNAPFVAVPDVEFPEDVGSVNTTGQGHRWYVYPTATTLDFAWEYFVEEKNGLSLDTYYSPTVWTNHDILREDGTVSLEATDPIPIYE